MGSVDVCTVGRGECRGGTEAKKLLICVGRADPLLVLVMVFFEVLGCGLVVDGRGTVGAESEDVTVIVVGSVVGSGRK